MTRDGEPVLARTNGTWFIWAVASQSLAVGMTMIHPHVTTARPWVALGFRFPNSGDDIPSTRL